MSNSDNKATGSSDAMFVTGICHAKGANKDIPAVWLPYFLVANIDEAIVKVNSLKGSLLTEVKSMGADRYIVIKDPAGASCALYQKG
jgi:predicted enzyme related to lactoylglutathione lyase